MATPRGVLIILNGWSGVGKHTVANELAKTLPNARVLDGHLFEALAGAVHPEGSEEYNQLRNTLTENFLQSLLPPVAGTPIYIVPFTLLLSTRRTKAPYLNLHPTYAIIHIILTCSTEAHISRLSPTIQAAFHRQHPPPPPDAYPSHAHPLIPNSAGRYGLTRKPVIDEHTLLEMKMEEELFLLKNGPKGIISLEADKLSGEYEVDTTRMDLPTTVGAVQEYVVEGARRGGVWIRLGPRKGGF